jgi:hypothetical protein
MNGTEFSKFWRGGPSFLFWRAGINSDLSVTFTSESLGGVAPDPLLKDFIWPSSSLFLATSKSIDVAPFFTEYDFITGSTSDVIDTNLTNQGYDVKVELIYNALESIIDFGLLPGQSSQYGRVDGGVLPVMEGSLVICMTNISNSSEALHPIVKVLVLFRVKCLPGGFELHYGQSNIRCGFKSMIRKLQDGCPSLPPSQLSRLYTINISDPNTPTMPDGSPINSVPDELLVIGETSYLNLLE